MQSKMLITSRVLLVAKCGEKKRRSRTDINQLPVGKKKQFDNIGEAEK
jgi:hypothetical protein